MDTVVKTVNIIHVSTFNRCELVGLLELTEREHNEAIYHINSRWLSQSALQRIFRFIERDNFLWQKENRDIEELNDELWVSVLAFLVDVTGHLISLNRFAWQG